MSMSWSNARDVALTRALCALAFNLEARFRALIANSLSEKMWTGEDRAWKRGMMIGSDYMH